MRSGEAAVGSASVAEHVRILGELVNVDEVRQRAKRVQRLQHASALEARLDADEKPDGGPEQNETVHGSFEGLDDVAEIARAHR